MELEGAELTCTDKTIITLVDNKNMDATPEYIKELDEYVGRHKDCCHFGGHVEYRLGKIDPSRRYAKVSVYID